MINVGITGGETLAAGELIRILINHPDVNLASVISDVYPGRPLTEIHRGLEGDTTLSFSPRFTPETLSKLNVIFLCGEPWQAEKLMAEIPTDTSEGDDAPLRIIDLTGRYRSMDGAMVYGLPENNRKALVRGATRAAIPSPGAMAIELALFPFLKGALLSGNIEATLEMASTENFVRHSMSQSISPEISTRFDPVAPAQYRSDAETIAAEIEAWAKSLQPTFSGNIRIRLKRSDEPRGIAASVEVPVSMPVADIRRIFDEAYEDHSFTYPISHRPETSEVANTNKCLIEISDSTLPDDIGGIRNSNTLLQPGTQSAVTIHSVIDNLLKGGAGNAVHCMNLLFGLSERTGLALKASAF